jgi:hypothetical protein
MEITAALFETPQGKSDRSWVPLHGPSLGAIERHEDGSNEEREGESEVHNEW